ncbi:LD-carboxypeptidase LdcB/DacB [Streptococcus anginosus]|uniref:GBS Bsp-like repeat protein n=1 Tax=Streptococcus anginosus subsp. whileyi CCUG 39159 TaxID=1095729 RepID=I0S9Y2_STRAP|nr:LD-carboxypeptidase LdcB/DacB [Streptococcus anginosus]AGU84215.1 surface antigen [Streptococcus anginosus C238]EID20185.1 GBS Bsp-like repeat protein [Streptococcus anginosus subsp. whileyi CCUG 39159]MDB8661764.1 LD-carboxypeptidase LdcB/DacB [Streptococcus anginosus]MDP1385633.1 LD-carboxypeptidase LdcB/DacB [Streptococcus anginosus]QQT08502.1 GBS Bsp-like repeat-containing protein [Streptococcus anginosus]
MKKMFDHKEQRFSIRKYSCGAASVLIGCVLFMGGQTVSADEQATTGTVPEAAQVGTANKTQNTTESIDVSSQSAATQKETAVTTTAPASSSADTGVAKTSSENTQKTITADKAVSVATETTPSQPTTVDAATQTEDETTNSSVDATTDTATPSTTVKVEKSPVEKEAGKEEADVAKLMDKTQPAQQARLAESKVTQSVPSLPSQGYYTYTKRTEVKNEPKASAALQFYVNAGDRVFYDQVLIADGYQWLSYRSYSGVRRYAAINKLIQSEPQQPAKQTPSSTGTFPSRGRYIFSGTTEVKNEAKLSAPTQFTFNRGDSVNYDKVLENDGYQWISYISYSGMRRYAAVTKLAQPAPQRPAQSQVTGTIHIENKTSQGFDVVVTNVNSTKGVKTVKLPIWSSQGGQDDIIWYDATKQNDGTYKLSVDIRRHKNNYGDYNVHMYYVQSDGSLQGVTGTTTKVEEPKYSVTGTIHIENKTSQGFDVVVTNVSSTKGVKTVKLPVWSSQGGQDDIIWYDAAKQTDGTYKLSVDIRRHKNNRGEYNIHMYYVQSDGSLQGVTGTTTKVEEPKYSVTGTIHIENKTSQGFDVVVTNVSSTKGVKTVKLPIWSSQGGQDDVIWYDAVKQTDGTYKLSVDIRRHKNNRGEYNIHMYYVQSDGSLQGVTGTTTKVEGPQTGAKEVQYNGSYYFIQGKYDEIVVANKKHPMAANYNPGENPTAKAAFLRLRNDMIAQGYNVGYAYSGFRSYDYQKVLYQNYVNKDGQAAADRYSARPGYNEHQTGLVFDLTDKAGNLLEDTAASNWLKNNAYRYGFVVRYQPGKEASTGYMPEAWHIRYIGKEADEVYHSGLSLEEYYGFEGGDYASSVIPSKPTTPSPQTPSIPAQGVYRFTKCSSIKAEARMSAPELAYYDAGQSVTYDKVLNADGATWISYIAFSGKRRYIAIA